MRGGRGPGPVPVAWPDRLRRQHPGGGGRRRMRRARRQGDRVGEHAGCRGGRARGPERNQQHQHGRNPAPSTEEEAAIPQTLLHVTHAFPKAAAQGPQRAPCQSRPRHGQRGKQRPAGQPPPPVRIPDDDAVESHPAVSDDELQRPLHVRRTNACGLVILPGALLTPPLRDCVVAVPAGLQQPRPRTPDHTPAGPPRRGHRRRSPGTVRTRPATVAPAVPGRRSAS